MRLVKAQFLWIVVLQMTFFSPATLLAEDQASPSRPAEKTKSLSDASSPTEESASSNVTIDFKDADIHSVLRVLSMKSGVNIVAGTDVKGDVTIRLVDVPWEKALDVVLKTYGYAYDRDDNIVRVTTLENLKLGELSTEVFVLNYSRAKEVEGSLKDMLSERGKIRSDERSNSVIVTDMPTIIQKMQTVVVRLDKSTPQVLIHAKVIEATLGDAEKLGIKWNARVGVSGSARPTSFPFSAAEQSNQFFRGFLPEGRAAVQEGSGGVVTTNADFPSTVNAHQSTFPVVDKSEYSFGTLDFSQLQVVMEAISSRSDTKILSEPRIMTLNNKEAKILVGEVIAIPVFERNTTTGKMEITGYQNKDLGIRLTVTPQVNDQKEIVVTVHPEITSLLGYDELTTDIKVPRFSTREAETQIRIQDGQTIVIGGLIRENKINTKTKFPVLGDIPLLDKFFSHEDSTVEKTELLFFMTVEIANEPPALQIASADVKK